MGERPASAFGAAHDAVTAARRELGRLLSESRRQAGFTQRQLGALTGYHHSVVAHSETGRPAAGEGFWKISDDVLGMNGTLAARQVRVQNLEQTARQQVRRQQQAAREARVTRALSDKRAPAATRPVPQQATAGYGVCPNCGQVFELVPQPNP